MAQTNKEVAGQLFESHPDKNCVYFTADGFAFFDKYCAESHAHNLDDKSLEAYAREVLNTSSLLDDEDDGPDEDDAPAQTEPAAPAEPQPKPAKKAAAKK